MRLNSEPPEWLSALKWFGVALAVGAGTGYYFFFGRSSATSLVQPIATLPTASIQSTAPVVMLATRTPDSVLSSLFGTSRLSEGDAAPDFTLQTLDGTATVTLSQYKSQPVLINFWASWCIPCRAEAADLEKAYRINKAEGFVLLGINSAVQDTVADAQAFVKEFRLTYPILWDEQDVVPQAYSVLGLPTSVFIDRQGHVERIHIGGMTGEQIDEFVGEILP